MNPTAPKPLPSLSPDDISRFWSHVEVRGTDECWPWRVSCFARGYGRFKAAGRDLKAHRVAFFLSTGQDLDDSLGCHTCDNPVCCNPAHIYAGTPKSNMQDGVARKRFNPISGDAHWSRVHPEKQMRGSTHVNAKLNEVQVAEMRAVYLAGGVTQEDLAARFGIARRAVSDVLNGVVWAHVEFDTERIAAIGKANRRKSGKNAKLTEQQVREIRALTDARAMTHPQLAEKFHVSSKTIAAIAQRRIWQHVK